VLQIERVTFHSLWLILILLYVYKNEVSSRMTPIIFDFVFQPLVHSAPPLPATRPNRTSPVEMGV
jgi:hypothetical protein